MCPLGVAAFLATLERLLPQTQLHSSLAHAFLLAALHLVAVAPMWPLDARAILDIVAALSFLHKWRHSTMDPVILSLVPNLVLAVVFPRLLVAADVLLATPALLLLPLLVQTFTLARVHQSPVLPALLVRLPFAAAILDVLVLSLQWWAIRVPSTCPRAPAPLTLLPWVLVVVVVVVTDQPVAAVAAVVLFMAHSQLLSLATRGLLL